MLCVSGSRGSSIVYKDANFFMCIIELLSTIFICSTFELLNLLCDWLIFYLAQRDIVNCLKIDNGTLKTSEVLLHREIRILQFLKSIYCPHDSHLDFVWLDYPLRPHILALLEG